MSDLRSDLESDLWADQEILMASRLVLTPVVAGYTAQDGANVLAVKLDGGASRYRQDMIGASATVDATWVLDAQGYRYLMAFYRLRAGRGALPFDIDLILDDADVGEYEAHFVPGSLALRQQEGDVYMVGAQLEVVPAAANTVSDEGIIDAYEGTAAPAVPVIYPIPSPVAVDVLPVGGTCDRRTAVVHLYLDDVLVVDVTPVREMWSTQIARPADGVRALTATAEAVGGLISAACEPRLFYQGADAHAGTLDGMELYEDPA